MLYSAKTTSLILPINCANRTSTMEELKQYGLSAGRRPGLGLCGDLKIIKFEGMTNSGKKTYKADEIFCFINPGNPILRAELSIPQINFGKIKKFQKVILWIC